MKIRWVAFKSCAAAERRGDKAARSAQRSGRWLAEQLHSQVATDPSAGAETLALKRVRALTLLASMPAPPRAKHISLAAWPCGAWAEQRPSGAAARAMGPWLPPVGCPRQGEDIHVRWRAGGSTVMIASVFSTAARICHKTFCLSSRSCERSERRGAEGQVVCPAALVATGGDGAAAGGAGQGALARVAGRTARHTVRSAGPLKGAGAPAAGPAAHKELPVDVLRRPRPVHRHRERRRRRLRLRRGRRRGGEQVGPPRVGGGGLRHRHLRRHEVILRASPQLRDDLLLLLLNAGHNRRDALESERAARPALAPEVAPEVPAVGAGAGWGR